MTSATKFQSVPSASAQPASIPLYSPGATAAGSNVITIGGRQVRMIVPPGGFAGFAQQTAATQALFQRAGSKGGKRSAKRRKTAKRATAKRTTKRRTTRTTKRRKAARLVKGSAAAKRYMASIRRKRRR